GIPRIDVAGTAFEPEKDNSLCLAVRGRITFRRSRERLAQRESEKAQRTGGDKVSASCWMFHRPPLMILGEFGRANQCPDKFAQPGLAIPTPRENAFQLPELIAGGRTAESGQVELVENLLIRCARLQ